MCLTEWVTRPSYSRPAFSSARAMGSGPASIGRSPRLSMNADTRAFACASSPAMNTSNGRPSAGPAARTWENRVLNALTTCAPAGAALAISCAPELPSGVTKPVASGVTGLVMSTMTLPSQRVPVLAYHRRRAGVRHREDDDVPGRGGAGRPDRGAAERGGQSLGFGRVAADDLDGVAACERHGRPMALAMFPRPMMLMLLMKYPVLVGDQKVDSSTIGINW